MEEWIRILQKLFYTNSTNKTMNRTSVISEVFYQYMVKGIIESNIREDGGLQCYSQIPPYLHYTFVIVLTVIHLTFLIKYKNHLAYDLQPRTATRFESRFAIFSFLSWLLTVMLKLKTQKGLFMLNPCHITILIQIYLMLNKNTKINTMIYTAWTGWLFGPYMATLIPHLNGIDEFQVLLYYFEHLAIIPCGYLILNYRYGFPKPTIRNHLPAFSTIALWQFWVLVPFSRANMVNLNFALCHSPADPSFQVGGPFYFVICTISLNVFAYFLRWISWIQIKMVYGILSLFGIRQAHQLQKSAEINDQETPDGEK